MYKRLASKQTHCISHGLFVDFWLFCWQRQMSLLSADVEFNVGSNSSFCCPRFTQRILAFDSSVLRVQERCFLSSFARNVQVRTISFFHRLQTRLCSLSGFYKYVLTLLWKKFRLFSLNISQLKFSSWALPVQLNYNFLVIRGSRILWTVHLQQCFNRCKRASVQYTIIEQLLRVTLFLRQPC